MGKKDKIKGLTKTLPLQEAAFLVLKFRFYKIKRNLKTYMDNSSPENLHELRISVRRLRYTLENFGNCYNYKEFSKILDYMKYMQDLTGAGRDLDVLEEQVRNFAEINNLSIPDSFYKDITEKKLQANHKIKLELMKFERDKIIKAFFTKKN